LQEGSKVSAASGVFLLGDDLRKLDQLRHLRWEGLSAKFQLVGLAEGVALEEERHQAAVPPPQRCCVEFERLRRAGGREFLLQGGNSRQSRASQPVACDFEQQGAARASPDSQPGLGLLAGHRVRLKHEAIIGKGILTSEAITIQGGPQFLGPRKARQRLGVRQTAGAFG
jgi:hypothetical protein